MKTVAKQNKRKSFLMTLGIHGAILLVAMAPIIQHMEQQTDEAIGYVIPIEFAEFAQSSEKTKAAASPVQDPEIKPVTEAINTEPDPIESEKIAEVAETTKETEVIESEVVEEMEREVVAAEDQIEGQAEETVSTGGTDASALEGNSEGSEAEGDETGHNGLDGTGVITRRVIHREDITQVARYDGVIAINLCIDRRGRVTAVSNHAERTTITDMDLVRAALDLAAGYRFETDYSAASRECGVLTFIFDVEDGYTDYVSAE